MYVPQIVQAYVHGITGRMLLFEYPLINTWTYKAAIEPLGKNHRTYPLPSLYFSQVSDAPKLSKFS
jgi:hypothetical protein